MFVSLLTGVTLGLSIAMPFGPVSLLCIQRSIAAGAKLGIATGLGAATVHGLYATMAIAGGRAISTELTTWGQPVRYLSGGLLIVLGARVLRRATPASTAPRRIKAAMAFSSSFTLAICNPLTILPYLLFASSFAAMEASETSLTLWSVVGVVFGVTCWYSVISGCAALFRSALPAAAVSSLNFVAGAVLIGFGFFVLWR